MVKNASVENFWNHEVESTNKEEGGTCQLSPLDHLEHWLANASRV